MATINQDKLKEFLELSKCQKREQIKLILESKRLAVGGRLCLIAFLEAKNKLSFVVAIVYDNELIDGCKYTPDNFNYAKYFNNLDAALKEYQLDYAAHKGI